MPNMEDNGFLLWKRIVLCVCQVYFAPREMYSKVLQNEVSRNNCCNCYSQRRKLQQVEKPRRQDTKSLGTQRFSFPPRPAKGYSWWHQLVLLRAPRALQMYVEQFWELLTYQDQPIPQERETSCFPEAGPLSESRLNPGVVTGLHRFVIQSINLKNLFPLIH